LRSQKTSLLWPEGDVHCDFVNEGLPGMRLVQPCIAKLV
jgi:hypothetical protein